MRCKMPQKALSIHLFTLYKRKAFDLGLSNIYIYIYGCYIWNIFLKEDAKIYSTNELEQYKRRLWV